MSAWSREKEGAYVPAAYSPDRSLERRTGRRCPYHRSSPSAPPSGSDPARRPPLVIICTVSEQPLTAKHTVRTANSFFQHACSLLFYKYRHSCFQQFPQILAFFILSNPLFHGTISKPTVPYCRKCLFNYVELLQLFHIQLFISLRIWNSLTCV